MLLHHEMMVSHQQQCSTTICSGLCDAHPTAALRWGRRHAIPYLGILLGAAAITILGILLGAAAQGAHSLSGILRAVPSAVQLAPVGINEKADVAPNGTGRDALRDGAGLVEGLVDQLCRDPIGCCQDGLNCRQHCHIEGDSLHQTQGNNHSQ